MNGKLLDELRSVAEQEDDIVRRLTLAGLADVVEKLDVHLDQSRDRDVLVDKKLDDIEDKVDDNTETLTEIKKNPTVVIGEVIQKVPKIARIVITTAMVIAIIALSNRMILRAILLGAGIEIAFVDLVFPP